MHVKSRGRRRLLFAAGGICLPSSARAQLRTQRVLWLSVFTQAAGTPFLKSFIEGLAAHGYVEGRNLTIDARWGDNSPEQLDRLAQKAVALKPAVIVTHGPAVRSVLNLSDTTPVVIGFSGDPIELGIAKSLGRPGGRFTGVTMLAYDLVAKRVEMLHEIAPKMRRLAVLSRPDHAGDAKELEATRGAATRFRLEVAHFPARTPVELQSALTKIEAMRADSLVIHPDGLFVNTREAIARFAMQQRVPAISGWSELADSGLLITYGPNREEIYRRLAYFVDRILRGTSPQDLPIEQPTRIELVINMRAASALGIQIPPTIMVRADRTIA